MQINANACYRDGVKNWVAVETNTYPDEDVLRDAVKVASDHARTQMGVAGAAIGATQTLMIDKDGDVVTDLMTNPSSFAGYRIMVDIGSV